MVWRIQHWAALAVTLSAVSGFAVPPIFQKLQLEHKANSLHELLRLARSEPEINSASVHAEDAACIALYQCWTNSGLPALFQLLFSFDFVELTDSLPARCSEIEASSCNYGDCPTIPFAASIADWVCTHVQDFENGTTCWADPFKEELANCTSTMPNGLRARIPYLRQCFATTVRGYSTCTTQNQDFFIQFSNLVLDEQERTSSV